ncbi:MAG: KamA family radical SAM protein [Chitinivibrionales bacterium]|nr:KamA family radical SAM protein [Chitinivibrionales bacterium]
MIDQTFITSVDEFLAFLSLNEENAPYGILKNPPFPFLVSREFACRIVKNEWYDPLFLQTIPRTDELITTPGFCDDAVGDHVSMVTPGLIQKYSGRVLLLTASCCAIHCRYCLRRCYSCQCAPQTSQEWAAVWRYLQTRHDIHEIILSGGEPFMLDIETLEYIFSSIEQLEQITTIRIHTRLPIALPHKINASIADLLRQVSTTKRTILVVHINHSQEMDTACATALQRLSDAGCMLFNQSVLLAGINDSIEALSNLCMTLVAHRIIPYYLHQLDRVSGCGHFEVDQQKGIALMQQLRSMLPGYAVPRYVREKAGAKSKLLIDTYGY